MILKAILCVQHFCSFAVLKTDSIVICVPCMLHHVCYEPFSLKKLWIWKISYVNWLNFCILSEIHVSNTRFKQINENLV